MLNKLNLKDIFKKLLLRIYRKVTELIMAQMASLNIDYWRGFFLLIILNILIFYSFIFIDKI
ncbi:hypothetical protein J691_4020 [Acinetobacter baumannii 981176]|nr:hypothetical protein J691_4020 [Acinetobacter baumannii 981176]HBX4478993.1 hypothetical protein [Klebsiella pneumoniae]